MDITPELREDKLTDTDWRDIEDILRLLEPFKMLTILGEERGTLYGSVSSTLWGFDMLLGMLEEERRKSRSKDAPFQKALDASWGKLDKYYTLTDKCPVYIVALMLDPRQKFQYFQEKWRADWLKNVKQKMRTTFDQYRCAMENTLSTPTPATSTPATSIPKTTENSFNIYKWRFGDMQQKADELTRYLHAPILVLESEAANDAFDPLEW